MRPWWIGLLDTPWQNAATECVAIDFLFSKDYDGWLLFSPFIMVSSFNAGNAERGIRSQWEFANPTIISDVPKSTNPESCRLSGAWIIGSLSMGQFSTSRRPIQAKDWGQILV